MAFVTGTATSLANLLSAIQTACTDNGWTLSGDVLHKGTCYIEIKVDTSVIGADAILIRAGTGIDGSNALTGACDTLSGNLATDEETDHGTQAWTWPCTYFIHVATDPDEVYVVCNYAVSFYQTLGFGQSALSGLTGTGNWYCGVGIGKTAVTGTAYRIEATGEQHFGTSGAAGFSLFCRGPYQRHTFGVDHQLDSATWAVADAARDWGSIAFRQPNQWNQEAILTPIRVYASRPSGFYSPVLECAHARFVVISALEDQQVITLGTDKWRVYPWWSRGEAYTFGGGNGTFTGQFGHAIRYDGS